MYLRSVLNSLPHAYASSYLIVCTAVFFQISRSVQRTHNFCHITFFTLRSLVRSNVQPSSTVFFLHPILGTHKPVFHVAFYVSVCTDSFTCHILQDDISPHCCKAPLPSSLTLTTLLVFPDRSSIFYLHFHITLSCYAWILSFLGGQLAGDGYYT